METSQMEARLRAFYARHNPGNDQNIAEIVRKFAGRESQLCAKLFKKYGEAPDLSPGGGQGAESRTKASTLQAAVKYQWNFKPYELAAATDSPLDFRSAQFDAFKALQAPKKLLKLPVTTAYPLDNIQKCRHLLPESDANRQTLVARPKKTSPAAAEAKAAVAKKTSAAAAAPSLFEQLADTYLDGPFQVLRRCFLERMRVFVVVRRINSVRGTCSGFLKAFDKHMNLVLLDVTQEFVPHSTHERLLREVREGTRAASDAVFSVADHRRNQRVLASAGGTQREYIKQVFIRGDNVVSVSAVAGNNAERRGYGTARPNKPRP
ncbi:Ribonucleoprotein LSM domain [Phytophthora cinnamomi]|uniref:Ribonucleoprotein LSM domain n=1 Tax=Phytophthora cinnamomi TaxID=4785 RepID=UPI003559B5FC|nr:Ribonucleoprotein LSM domain [Phytophthora cinnamomi]